MHIFIFPVDESLLSDRDDPFEMVSSLCCIKVIVFTNNCAS